MNTRCFLQVLLAVLLTTQGASVLADDDRFTPAPIDVPDGFTVEVAAGPPLVKHPMMAGLDDRGRLFIAETAGENLPRQELEKRLPNFIRMIEDTNGDGVFDKSTIFADQLTYPMGALWHDGWLYVASSGAIWRFKDTDDDGVADVREQLVNEFGYTGNAADVHGCFLGPMGRIYWCEGRHGHEFRDDNGHVLSKGKAARIFSMQPDGSDVQVHCGGGMDNPVEIDFTDDGEMLGTVNILYRQRGDCLVHWVRGGVYPRHDQPQVTAEFKQTGDLLPPVINLGHVAVSGTTRYRSTHLGQAFKDNFFITEFNTHKVVRTKLTRHGSTFTAEAFDFLSSSSSDFHPTDVLEDADGSLLVIDTGGWFLRGCPTSKIAKPTVYGAIYRIRRKGGETLADARGGEIDWDTATTAELAALLDDQRHIVRERSIQALRKRGPRVVAALSGILESGSVRATQNAVRVLARVESTEARTEIYRVLKGNVQIGVRRLAAMSVCENFDERGLSPLIDCLTGIDESACREAATALGKLGDSRAVEPLLSAIVEQAPNDVDRLHEHAIIYALIEINDREATASGLTALDPRIQRAALIALDQMDDGNLRRSEVTALVDTSDLALQQAVVDVIARHPEWNEEVVGVVTPLLAAASPSDKQLQSARKLLVAFAGTQQVQRYVGNTLAESNVSAAVRGVLLEVIRDANLTDLPNDWRASLVQALTSDNEALLTQAIRAVEHNKSAIFDEALQPIASDEKRSAAVRIRALAASNDARQLSGDLFQFLAGQLRDDAAVTQRLSAASVIGSSRLNASQLSTATKLVASAGPLELSGLLGAFESNADDAIGRELLASLAESPGLPNLSPSMLDRVFRASSPAIREQAATLGKKLVATDADQVKRLASLEAEVAGGDPRRGHAVFTGQRTACAACHQVKGQGGRIGPDLSTTGARRNTRDLLEAILYPSSSLARGFESFIIVTTAGKVYTGMILSETDDAIRLRTIEQKEVTLRRAEIDELHPSQTSIMPAGLDRTMSKEDVRDLVAYLKSLK